MYRFAALVGIAALTASAAGAAVIQVSYMGVITYSKNTDGIFGGVHTGHDFVLDFVFDTDLGPKYSLSPTRETMFGPAEFPFASPLVSATLMVGSVSYLMSGNTYSGHSIATRLISSGAQSLSPYESTGQGLQQERSNVQIFAGGNRVDLGSDLETPFFADLSQNRIFEPSWFQGSRFEWRRVFCMDHDNCRVTAFTDLGLGTNRVSVMVDGVAGPEIFPIVTPVPLQASAVFLGTGLLAFFSLKRRKART